MIRKMFREKAGEWCEVKIELRDSRLSICGSAGNVLTSTNAKREAFRFWESYFQDDPGALADMARDHGRRTPRSAALYVLACDGDYHGLDVPREEGHKVYVTRSCGQIVDDIKAWFPEVEPYLKWHLNDMHAECEHQEARGETFTTHPKAVCPDCGYAIGTAWLRRELPAEVVAWAEGRSAA